jgi:hypothetical protein
VITAIQQKINMKKDKEYPNFIQWFWERTLYYKKAGKLPSWPYRYRRLNPYFILKYYSTLGEIDLEKVIVGELNTNYIFVPAEQWDASPQYLLRNSPFVEFLRCYGDQKTVNKEEFLKTSYYKFMLNHFKINKRYHSVTDPSKLMEHANYFLKLYHSIRDGSYTKEYKTHYNAEHMRSLSKYPSVIKLKNGFWGIRDGHHRLAANYCLKNRWVRAHILKEKDKLIWNR